MWLNFKTHFSTAYAHVQEYQRTTAQANFHGTNNLTADIDNQTNTTQDKLQQFISNIAAEQPEPPTHSTTKIFTLKVHVNTLQSQVEAMQA